MKSWVIRKLLHSEWFIYLFLTIISIIVHYPVLKNGFLTGWDDHWMVFNYYTEGGWTAKNLWHIFSDFYGSQYGPFTELSYLVIYTFWGYEPFYFHLASLLWHIGCVCLIWNIFYSLLKDYSSYKEWECIFIATITSLLFNIHPMNIEAIAWISAVKVLIYAFFYLLGIVLYLYYIKSMQKKYYIGVLLCFIVSFLGKEQAITFPLFLLIIDWFTHRNIKSELLWLEKVPFFIMALFGGFITILSQGNSGGTTTFPFLERILFACYSLMEYITKSIFPIRLNFLYPFPIVPGEKIPMYLYMYPLICIFIIIWIWIYRKNIYLIFSVLLFVVNLICSIHIIPMARHAIVADRYLYLSYIGMAFFFAYNLCFLYKKGKRQWKYTIIVFGIYCIYLSIYSFYYATRWKNTVTVKQYMKEIIEKRPDISLDL